MTEEECRRDELREGDMVKETEATRVENSEERQGAGDKSSRQMFMFGHSLQAEESSQSGKHGSEGDESRANRQTEAETHTRSKA